MGKPKSRGNGQGSAIKRGSTWQSRVVVGWKENKDKTKMLPIIKTKGGFKTKKEALLFCEKLKEQNGRMKNAPILAYYWNIYQADLDLLSKDRRKAYCIAWNKMKAIQNKPVDAIMISDLRSVVSENAKTYYPARDMKTVLNKLFDLAAADKFADKSLPEYIVLPKLKEEERVPFTKDEVEKLWKSYYEGNKNAAIPLIMIYTGMMTGEMRRLTVQMINLRERKITGVGIKTKTRKDSVIYLASDIIPILESYAENKTEKLFPSDEATFYKVYYEALEKAKIRRLTPHSCRHTTATTLAVEKNVDSQTVKKIMRWSTAKMLDRYAHPNDDSIVSAIEMIGK